MALVVPQAASYTGVLPTGLAQPTTSETIVPDDRCLYVIEIGATSTTVTLVVPGSAYGTARPDITVASAATNTKRYVNTLVSDLADPTTGLITITFSNVTNVLAGLIRV